MKIGTTELILILAVVMIIFGPTQLPKLAKMLGQSIKGLRDGMDAGETDSKVSDDAGQAEH